MLKEVGAKFITSTNALLSVAPPVIYNGGQPLYPGVQYNAVSPALGPWTRYLCYRDIATISLFVPGIDQAAVGELMDPSHTIEAMMLGAKIVEFFSGTLWKGFNLIKQTADFVEKYMTEQGYASCNDLSGLGVGHIRPVYQIDWGIGKLAAKTDPENVTVVGPEWKISVGPHIWNGKRPRYARSSEAPVLFVRLYVPPMP